MARFWLNFIKRQWIKGLFRRALIAVMPYVSLPNNATIHDEIIRRIMFKNA
jgi:hypothetical protein